jgi:2-polyprenyl-6-methoxyphenol hydroxylase-like FAD-dependent oxidoreductase
MQDLHGKQSAGDVDRRAPAAYGRRQERAALERGALMHESASIGIVGSGVSGLHLGLFLRAHDVPVTMYTDKQPDAIRAGRLLNTVGHHHHTLERERALRVHHWDAAEYGYVCHHHYVAGDPPLRFRGDFDHPSSVIDYRLYLPRLMEDFLERGGEIVDLAVDVEGVERLSHRHDLMVVAVGRGGMGELFPRRPEKSPYDRPQRRLSAGIYRGIAYSEPKGVNIHFSPGHGELLELPIYSHEGFGTALLLENVPGGDLEVLADVRYEDDPVAFDRLVLEKLRAHYPMVVERIDDASAFGLWSGRDILQGALTPVVREDYARLDSGRFAIAMGDCHTVVDPMMGQGANAASFSAWTIGEAILADHVYDERFCQGVARARERMVLGVSDWTNLMLNPPPHVLQFIGAMSQDKALCDEFTTNFNDPARQVDVLATPQRTSAYLADRAGAAREIVEV